MNWNRKICVIVHKAITCVALLYSGILLLHLMPAAILAHYIACRHIDITLHINHYRNR